ncbi:uncharacterized protein BDR25DRAFT_306614 [Lindgomyces ingoldianus]|uniref:Uncharacterized protein n=1 Tax=Lindgomyces ingoldianus TaxID=673940 RepID=A0ACB6QFY5_9PLEO|nr:uncharacterized protein BDR25DRAFT_306614 [Lindgomyces ingoldianus]KAF2465473.1 hypothetical protein BDR25DRAFT_306614 [Lindgomyces ingoldianus]
MAVPNVADGSVAPKSTHLYDPTLQPFLQSTFDPADYLNVTLPSLSLSSVSSRPLKQGTSVPLADLSTQTQDLLSQLNAHTTRLSTILTQLTDDILRSGGRLAYEVEVLRGETIGLTEALSEGLKGDVEKFLPGGIMVEMKKPPEPPEDVKSPVTQDSTQQETKARDIPKAEDEPTTPPYISQLRTLTLVRSRLESVIKIFGEAMHWTLAPSEVSLASSLISVSAPEPGSDSASREEKGREFAEKLRTEISDLISGGEGDESGVEAAMIRIQALRDLAQVWRGTAEEKSRIKFVESLVKLVEEKQKAIENAANQRQKGGRNGSVSKLQPPQKSSGGGFLDNLQRIRGNIYLE